MNGDNYEPVDDAQLYHYHSSQAEEVAAASSYSPALSNGGSPNIQVPAASATSPAGGITRFFGRTSDDTSNYRHLHQAPLPPAGDSSFREYGQRQQHHHGTPQSLTGIIDGRSPMNLSLSMSPPVGGVFSPARPYDLQGGQEDHFHQQQRSSSRTPTSLALSPMGGADGGGYSPGVAAQRHGQEQQQLRQSAVGAVIAEVATRRSGRSRSQQQSQDMDIVRRGTPISDGGRQAMAQPRLLLSELDADGPSSTSPAAG